MATTLAALLLLLPSGGNLVSALKVKDGPSMEFIPRTKVPMPDNYDDYTRGHPVIPVFPNNATIPGERHQERCPGEGLPCFDPAHPETSQEVFMAADKRDVVGAKCCPGGQGGVGHYIYNVWVPELIVWQVKPGTPGRSRAAVIVAPGGGYIHLAWESSLISPTQWLNSLGITVFALKYRLPNLKAPQLDAQRAMSLVRSRAEEFDIDPNLIGFMGDSASGHLGIEFSAARKRGYDRIDAVDDVDFRPNFLLLLYPGVTMLQNWNFRQLPPTFVAYSVDDQCVNGQVSRFFVKVARKTMRSALTVYEFPDGGHGWQDPLYFPSVEGKSPTPWRNYAETWLHGLGVL